MVTAAKARLRGAAPARLLAPGHCPHLSSLPTHRAPPQDRSGTAAFLRQYHAGWVYSIMGTIGVGLLERQRRYEDAIHRLQQLLGGLLACVPAGSWQAALAPPDASLASDVLVLTWPAAGASLAGGCFCRSRRGEWWERLAINMEHLNRCVQAHAMAACAWASPGAAARPHHACLPQLQRFRCRARRGAACRSAPPPALTTCKPFASLVAGPRRRWRCLRRPWPTSGSASATGWPCSGACCASVGGGWADGLEAWTAASACAPAPPALVRTAHAHPILRHPCAGKPPRRWKRPAWAPAVERQITEVRITGRPLNNTTGGRGAAVRADGHMCVCTLASSAPRSGADCADC